MGDKTFNLTWNNHLANLSGLFEGLYKSGSLTDTTLACQGGMLRAHRLVLAACSPYFERVFKEHYGEQPILILKGVAVEEMECLLDFMYRGSIDVAEEHLPSLIKTSTDLEIRGLSGDHRNEIANSYPRNQRCLIETRVSTTEFRKDPASMYRTAQATLQTPGEPRIKVEDIEVEDDPMVIDGQEEPFDEASTSNDHLRQLPPPLYRRDSRFRGQKRVSVGRLSRSGEMLDSRSKDLSTPGDSFDESILLQEAMRPEVNFSISGSDPTVPSIQMNDEEQEGDEHANLEADKNLEELGESTDTSSNQQKSLNMRNVQCNLTDAEIAEKNVEYRQNTGEPAPKTMKYPITCEATRAFPLAQRNAASIQTNVSCVQRTERNPNTSSFSYRSRYVPVRYNSPNIFPNGLKAYLHTDIRGRTVIASGDKLDSMSRQKVVRCVVDYLFMNFSFGNIIRKEHFVKAASEIVLAYPEEIESTYFVPGTPRTKTASKTLNKGKLWSRYCNVKIRLGGAKTNTLKDGTEEQPIQI